MVKHYLGDAGAQLLPESLAPGPVRTLRFRPSMWRVNTRASAHHA